LAQALFDLGSHVVLIGLQLPLAVKELHQLRVKVFNGTGAVNIGECKARHGATGKGQRKGERKEEGK
jgi:hypothetical protein